MVPADDPKEKAVRKSTFWRAMQDLREAQPPLVCIVNDFAWRPVGRVVTGVTGS